MSCAEDLDSASSEGAQPPICGCHPRGSHKERRFCLTQFAGDALHRAVIELVRLRHDRKRIAGERLIGEDIDEMKGDLHNRYGCPSRSGSTLFPVPSCRFR